MSRLCPISSYPCVLLRLTVVALFVSAGCSRTPGKPLPTTFPVTGKVVFEGGQPLAGGAIQFQSTTDPAMTAVGEIQPDGAFSLVMPVDGEKLSGAVEGTHRVTVMPPDSGDQTAVPILLEQAYSVEPKENSFAITIGEPG